MLWKKHCDKKDEDISEKMTLANTFELKELHDIKSAKDKTVEASTNLG